MVLSCQLCGIEFAHPRPTKYCSGECRAQGNNLRHGLTCSVCGAPMAQSRGSLAPDAARCRKCRCTTRSRICPDCCGPKGMSAVVCRSCRAKRQQVRADDDRRVMRHQRERAAPGVPPVARKRLLAKWKLQGRRCAYCASQATSIDHVVPLVRGGTNYEGNLVPCCTSCNSRKGGRLLVEVKAGRKAPRMSRPVTWKPKQPKPQPFKIEAIRGEQAVLQVCICGSAHVGRGPYCSQRCRARTAYRIKVGIPLDAAPYEVRACA